MNERNKPEKIYIEEQALMLDSFRLGKQVFDKGFRPDLIAIRVHGIEYLVDRLNAEDKLLLVDDVFSSGVSVQAVKEKLRRKLRHNCPEIIKVAAVWHRPVEGLPGPDYYVHQTDGWLVLPYELSGLTIEEIRANKPWVATMLDEVN